jgi:glycosyltransferase involved in cell wall biosynthesis
VSKKIYCFSADRICHHDDYFLIIDSVISSINIKNKKTKIQILLSKKSIVFLDIDGTDLIYFFLIILRKFWGGKGLAISVRTEYLLEKKSLADFIFRRNRLIFIKSLVKRSLFFILKNYSSTSILSIHVNHYKKNKMKPYVSDFINDPQLWDLGILNILPKMPVELNDFKIEDKKKLILVAGRFNEQKSKNELLEYLLINKNFNFLIAGNIDDEDFIKLKSINNCYVINRFLNNEELIYSYDQCDIVYCFYTNDRPSGFFGRAMQMNKDIIVRKNKFLHLTYNSYRNLIPIDQLEELDELEKLNEHKILFNNLDDNSKFKFNDRKKFQQIIKKL